MDDKTTLTTIGIICITALAMAQLLCTGQDGAIITTVCSLIAGIVGYEAKSYQVQKQTVQE